jgi:hypothetical protein
VRHPPPPPPGGLRQQAQAILARLRKYAEVTQVTPTPGWPERRSQIARLGPALSESPTRGLNLAHDLGQLYLCSLRAKVYQLSLNFSSFCVPTAEDDLCVLADGTV